MHTAQAQPVTRPELVSEAPAAYPEGASGEGRVVLKLRVGAGGAVEEVTVLEGAEPFAGAAAAAARRFVFKPATRDAKPISAFVRFELRFSPPAPEPPPTAPSSADSAAPAANAPPPLPPPPGEVTIAGDRPPPGARSLTRAEVRELPGAFGDPFRAIEALPGVTPLVSGAPFFYVRGAPPGNVGYFLDGVRVPYLFHVFLGPSIVHPALVSRVDLFSGGYPARFGRFAGGVVSGELAAPVHALHGEANVRLIDAGAMVEAPIAGGRGSAMAAGRYSYTAALLSMASPDVSLAYWDYQARASLDVGSDDTVSVFAFGARDYLAEKQDDGTEATFFDAQFHRVDLRYDHRDGERARLRLATTVGYDRTGGGEGSHIRTRLWGLRTLYEGALSADVTVRTGSDVWIESLDTRFGDAEDDRDRDLQASLASRGDLSMGAHGEVEWQATPRVRVTPGARVDVYGVSTTRASPGAGAPGPQLVASVDPRLMARIDVTRSVRLLHAYGVSHQPPSFVVPLPGYQPSRLRGGLQQAVQTSAGVEAELPAALVGSVTLFQNAYSNMTDALSMGTTTTSGPARFESRADGKAVGVEVLLRRSLTKALGGYVSYTFSRSARQGTDGPYLAGFDRPHVLSAALAYGFGRGYRIGGRTVVYSGLPRYVQTFYGPPERQGRQPAFFRLDVRFEKRWQVGEAGWVSFVLEALNATLSRETLGVSCTVNGCKDQTFGPVTVPSLGVEGGF